ncbi:F-box protein At2g32560-like [Curcuma longa]|uniref:F-box protein At2g32560-like n=1 Tax=Curcuma longa TaxID=136217 RepID=UPI003D9FA207
MTAPRKRCGHRVANVESSNEATILQLPDLALECILEKLPPAALCRAAAVCSSLREICTSDRLWERHVRQKWGRLFGPAAQREWKFHVASGKDSPPPPPPPPSPPPPAAVAGYKSNRWFAMLACVLPIGWLRTKKPSESPPDGSFMALYRALENGQFWFPAQVYNREHGHVGFLLSCYDAEVSYDRRTDSFRARYPPHGRRAVVEEYGVEWDRLRPPPIESPAHDLRISELHPGDHIEIQWRRNKEFPYGWWYGVIGHLGYCDGNSHFCHCHLSDTVVLEFNQYTSGSRWRQALVNRKDHHKEGSETDGYYGGIRKLKSKDEISKWRQLWPSDAMD